MKKVFEFIKRYSCLTALFFVFAIFFNACNVGLGEVIDLEAPVLKLTSHKDNDTVPGSFTLTGEASDNDGISIITIDFEDSEIHYKIEPKKSSKWQKKTSFTSGWVDVDEGESSFSTSGKTSTWSVYVRTEEKSSSKTDSNFSFEVLAKDTMGNNNANSKAEISLIVDENNPDVNFNTPATIFMGTYESAKNTTDSFELKRGDVIAKLLNGDLTFAGRQSNSISFKELKIEFDDGKLSSGVAKVTGDAMVEANCEAISKNVSLGDEGTPKVYYSKTLKLGEGGISNLRNWEFDVKAEDWISDETNPELKTGKHLIRIVSTSVSESLAWQKKVIGYFVLWQEADIPWISMAVGDTEDKGDFATEVYPSSPITVNAYDDDGIAKLTYKLQKKTEEGWASPEEDFAPLLEENAKYTSWNIKAPKENGNYKLTLEVTDINGNSDSIERYFKIMDIQPPEISIEGSANSSSVLENSDATIRFKGFVSDDGVVKKLSLVHLNPAKSGDPDNRTKYLAGSESDWDKATLDGWTDSNGNILYSITLTSPVYDEELKANKYEFDRTFNLFDDLKIDGVNKLLEAQEFIFRALDDGNSTRVESLSLTGDNQSPKLTLDSLKLYDSAGVQVGNTKVFAEDSIPTLPIIKTGYYAVIDGTWSDNSTTVWNDSSKIGDIVLTYQSKAYSVTKGSDGRWTSTITGLKSESTTILASLKDYGGNERKISASVFVEGAAIGLERVGCDSDDGEYKAGSEILVTLEFSKNVTFSGTNPSLTLNSGGTAQYKEGNGTSKHVFAYTVGAGDLNVEKLGVTAVNDSATTWKDRNTDEIFEVVLPVDDTKKLETSRSIKIDTIAPKIQTITAITTAGHYKDGKQISLMLSFTETVTVENSENLKLVFTHQNGGDYVKSTRASGTSIIIFDYVVASGDNTAELKLHDIVRTGVSVKDGAGNNLTDWTLPNTSFANKIVIDTNPPAAPTVNANWLQSTVFDQEGTSFTVTGESNSVIEYTTDGLNWSTYKGEVLLKNNGTYLVMARQTDLAGNISTSSSVKTVTVDKGSLLKRISATTVNGTYSTNTSTNVVDGFIEFRKTVSIPQGAKVTLNIKNINSGTSSKDVAINECVGAEATNKIFTFTYTIVDGDFVNDDGNLDLIGWSFTSVKYDSDTDVDMSVPDIGEGKRFKENREIKIITGKPAIKSVSLEGEGEEARLSVVFDREISKVSGNITFTHDTASYKVPAILSVSEYGENSAFATYYTRGVSGATKNSDNTLTPDTTTKYVLNFEYETDNTTIKNLFINADKHKVSVPVVASAVSVSGKTLKINLGKTYKLPVKGSTYTLAIPSGIVVDQTQNGNNSYTQTLVAEGIESPEIRIKKNSYSITGNSGATPTANSSITMAGTAQVKMSCRTPGTTILYATTQKTSNQVKVNSTPNPNNTKTADATVPANLSNTYASNFTIGDSNLSYANVKGIKIAIVARAQKGSAYSDYAYESANRTVLKFETTAAGKVDTNGEVVTEIIENGTALRFKNLKVWVIGGDTPYGGNTISPFPLSWGDSSDFKLMSGNFSSTDKLLGEWYWVSWDISAPTYHGFVLGDVPSDAMTKGPTIWYAAECAWVAQKDQYPLYPGETLCMAIETASSFPSNFLFRLKNKGSR